MAIETVPVQLDDAPYSIHIGEHLLASPLPLAVAAKKAVLLTDRNTAGLYAPQVQQQLEARGLEVIHVSMDVGDAAKNFATLEQVCSTILASTIDRKTLLIALGGGVVGDLGGFAASMLVRGIPFIQMPTTLLAAVDSSVGGKTAINTPQGKNLIGAFYQPRQVLIDTAYLKTLQKREIMAGYAEILKYGLINDAGFFAWLEQHGAAVCTLQPDPLIKAIRHSVAAKAAIVAKDPHENKGLRALLNLGHTFGHALEAELQYSPDLLHGEAVAMGCLMAAHLSVARGIMPSASYQHLKDHQQELGFARNLPDLLQYPWQPETLVAHMLKDKKTQNGKKTFILLRDIGQAFVADDVTDAEILATLREFTNA